MPKLQYMVENLGITVGYRSMEACQAVFKIYFKKYQLSHLWFKRILQSTLFGDNPLCTLFSNDKIAILILRPANELVINDFGQQNWGGLISNGRDYMLQNNHEK